MSTSDTGTQRAPATPRAGLDSCPTLPHRSACAATLAYPATRCDPRLQPASETSRRFPRSSRISSRRSANASPSRRCARARACQRDARERERRTREGLAYHRLCCGVCPHAWLRPSMALGVRARATWVDSCCRGPGRAHGRAPRPRQQTTCGVTRALRGKGVPHRARTALRRGCSQEDKIVAKETLQLKKVFENVKKSAARRAATVFAAVSAS